jgi:hypothetical protein
MRSFQDFSSYPGQRSRRETAGQLACAVLFSVIEIWAVVVVLTQVRVPDVQAAALAFVLSGALMATWPEWQKIRSILRSVRQPITGLDTETYAHPTRAPGA